MLDLKMGLFLVSWYKFIGTGYKRKWTISETTGLVLRTFLFGDPSCLIKEGAKFKGRHGLLKVNGQEAMELCPETGVLNSKFLFVGRAKA